MSLHVNIGGAYKGMSDGWVNINGVWKKISSIHTNIGGTWKAGYSASFNGVIALASGSSNVYASSDGITWGVRGTLPNTISAPYTTVAYGNGIWVIYGGDGYTYSSTDAITWTKSSLINSYAVDSGYIMYSKGNFVMHMRTGSSTYTIFTSPDGITWTNRGALNHYNCWAAGDLLVLKSSSSGSSYYRTSNDGGVSWTSSTPATTDSIIGRPNSTRYYVGSGYAMRGPIYSGDSRVFYSTDVTLSGALSNIVITGYDGESDDHRATLYTGSRLFVYWRDASSGLEKLSYSSYPGAAFTTVDVTGLLNNVWASRVYSPGLGLIIMGIGATIRTTPSSTGTVFTTRHTAPTNISVIYANI